MKGMTLFTGGGGADIGMTAAGVEMVAGIEYDADISSVARLNGIPVTVADILAVDPGEYAGLGIDALHASPPCPNFSVAKTGRGETENDLALARAVCGFIAAIQPKIFTLENVIAYRDSQSWRMIEDTLFRLGYLPDLQHVNAADYGVPQSRRRMIVRAIRGQMVPHLPEPVAWVGWYAAIEDLIQTLPESKFAPWQMDRLPEELKDNTIFTNQAGFDPVGLFSVSCNDPSPSVVSSEKSTGAYHAFLVNTREWHGSDSADYTAVDGRQPCYTVAATSGANRHKAFLVNGALSVETEKTLQIHPPDEPTGTIVSTMNSVKDTRAWLSTGRVVKMTPRALARFQSFPDWYQLPDKSALACKGIGNAVPPLMMEKIYRGLLEAI